MKSISYISPGRNLAVTVMLVIMLLSPGFVKAKGGKVDLPEAELTRLNHVMGSADIYMRDKMKHIDSLKTAYRELPAENLVRRVRYAIGISQAYLPVRADSALTYSEHALRLAEQSGNKSEEFNSHIARINALSTSGIFTRAVAEFNSIAQSAETRDMKISLWLAGRKLYGYMRTYVEGDRQFFNDYTNLYIQYDDSLINNLPASDPTRTFYIAERYVQRGMNKDAKKLLEELCASLPEESNLYGMAAFQLGIVSRNEGDPTAYASYLAKAAMSDIKGCVKDGYALPALAEWLYQQGELNDAFKYINFALEDATTGNVRMRTVSIAALLPMIDEAYREKINASRDELMIYFLLVTFLLLLTTALCVFLGRMIRRSRRNTRKLAQTANMQESYIGHFIGLTSTYATRLDSLQKLVTRKISSGQSDELLRMIKSGKFAADENDEFYKVFDSAFLDIYPDFIENINELLRPEERFSLGASHELAPEIRIYGLVRLGVEESTRIAQILNYSVSTVYAYRTRMRNKAIDRTNFDKNVMEIGRKTEQ